MQIREPHFQVLALAPFDLDTSKLWEGRPQPIERSTLDTVMSDMQIRFFLPLETSLCPNGGLDFQFGSLKALHPDGIAKFNTYFKSALEAKAFIQKARTKGSGAAQIREGLLQWPELPTIEINAESPIQKPAPSETRLENILDMVALSGSDSRTVSSKSDEGPRIDAILHQILTTLFENSQFRRLESAWRGLQLLLQQSFSNTSNISVSIATVHAENLAESLEALTPHVINNLPNVILLDLGFDSNSIALERMNTAAQWAATLMVPLIGWVPASFFQIATWNDMSSLPFIPHHLDTPEYAKFRKLQASAEGHWLSLTCNRFLVRYPYGRENSPRHVTFNESAPLWISPVWALGALVAQCADQTGWPTRFSDIRQFQVQDLALRTQAHLPPMASETLFDRDRLDQFARAGISPLASEGGRDTVFFPKAVTISGALLAYQLLLSQTTQFVLWCKDHLPAETNPSALQSQLEKALQQFSNQSRPAGFAHIKVTAAPPEEDGRIPVHVSLTPEAAVLSGRKAIELQLYW